MIEETVDVLTTDGRMTTFTCRPERAGTHFAVVLLMDALGIREELRQMARRLAASGFYVLLPNLYYRLGVMELGPPPLPTDTEGRRQITHMVSSLSVPMIMDDTTALLDYIDKQPAATTRELGCIGYCMSAQFAINAAARFSDRIVAAASIYGTGLMTDSPDSPHLAARQTHAELYFACAEIDEWTPLSTIEALRHDFAQAGVPATVELYPDVEHGFAFPERATYDEPAAERHWERLLALFHRDSR